MEKQKILKKMANPCNKEINQNLYLYLEKV